MSQCDCRSLSPFILLLFIPIMLLVDHHDTPQSSTSPPSLIDYSKQWGDIISGIKSYGYLGFIAFTAAVLGGSYKTWNYNKFIAIWLLLFIPMYYIFFISNIPLTSALPFPHVINQTGTSLK